MSNRRGHRAALLVVLALVGSLLVGCSGDDPDVVAGATGAVSATEAQEVLDTRARALREGNLETFLSTLDVSDAQLLKRQKRYYANLQDLPLQRFEYTVLKSDWPAELRSTKWGEDVSVPQVRVSTQLEGYDAVPVQRTTGFAFARVNGQPVIASELTGAGKQYPGSQPAPWDLVRIHTRTDGETLQLYDNDTVGDADEISSVVRRGVENVSEGLPFLWDGRVVVYVFARKNVLNSFEGVPGGNIRHLGAMTFPMYAVPGQPEVAGTRFTLLPSSVEAGQPFLDRIVRHELTHVAISDRDDGAPVWFAEGLAEYMGARTIRKGNRRIATVAVTRAREGVARLPSSATFNGADQAWNYALSWMACDYIAATEGEFRLWDLMNSFHNGGAGTKDEEQDAILRQILGYDGAELARRAEKRILRIYG